MKKIVSVERFRDMSILITGGVGFIGSHITERLAAKNHITDVELRIPKSCMKILGYRPRIDLLEGITKTGERYRQHPEAP